MDIIESSGRYSIQGTESEIKGLQEICQANNCTLDDLINNLLTGIKFHPEEVRRFIKENRTDKCKKGIPGKPVFRKEDWVGFYITPYGKKKEIFCKGQVYIIDRFGTFEQNEEPSYDIMVPDYNNTGEPMLVKHIRESQCYDIRAWAAEYM